MLVESTIEKLKLLKLHGMVRALESQMELKEARELSFDERLGMLLDAESLDRENHRTRARLRHAKLRLDACMEDLKIKASRGLDRATSVSLASCDWVRDKRNIFITGPTGAGKTYLACALAHSACRQGFSAVYHRASSLFDELTIAKADGRYKRMLAAIANKSLLILDDFGLEKLTVENRRDLLEIVEQRYGNCSTVITSQFEVKLWHDIIGDPTIADAILDRIVHNGHELKVKGKSLRDPATE
ncbi:MAG: IS21-like element helper ATPase IstB [Candidatus Obscuribacterales bacterium]|nr:IS21-like element helper ATPase IstB [Candidatus Obscuribacterales bacterium]